MKHTPAPWTADEENCADGLNVKDATGRRIAHTAATRRPDYTPIITEEAKANARLIAAAPELLEALEAVDAILYHYLDEVHPLRVKITDAISKAQGK